MLRIFIKKGAMFGLDARIALAIFAALSVVSGAALYNSIRESETVRMASEIAELRKAIQQYMLDTGLYLNATTPTGTNITIGNLFENYDSLAQWDGPYFGVDSTLNSNIELTIARNKTIDRLWNAKRAGFATWTGSTPSTASTTNCGPTDCGIFLRKSLAGSSSAYQDIVSLYQRLDEYVDGSDGAGSGDIRAVLTAGGTFNIYIRLIADYKKMNS